MILRQKDIEISNLKKELDIARQELAALRSQDDINYRQQQDGQRLLYDLERAFKSSQLENSRLLEEISDLKQEVETLHYSNVILVQNTMAIEKEKLSEDIKELSKSVSPTPNNNQILEKHFKEINSLKECIKNLEKQINEWSSSYYQLQKEMDQLIMEKHSYGRVSEKYDKSGINLHKDQPSNDDKINRSLRNRISSPPISETRSNYDSVRNRLGSPAVNSPPKAEPRSNYESVRHSPTRSMPGRSFANESSSVSNALVWKEPESRAHDSQPLLTFPSLQSAQNNSQIINNL